MSALSHVRIQSFKYATVLVYLFAVDSDLRETDAFCSECDFSMINSSLNRLIAWPS